MVSPSLLGAGEHKINVSKVYRMWHSTRYRSITSAFVQSNTRHDRGECGAISIRADRSLIDKYHFMTSNSLVRKLGVFDIVQYPAVVDVTNRNCGLGW